MVNQISGGFRSRLDSSSSITDNTFIEIFMYLPLTSIYRFRSVSKVWFSLLSDPNFITKWFQFNNKSLPWLQYHTVRLTFPFSDESPFQFRNSYPDLHSRFISRNEHFFSFEFLINEIPLEGAELYLLGSSNGLVLCFSVKNEDYSSEERRYHVYNPLTQKWVSIPLLPRSRGSRFAVSGIFCEFSLSASCCYKVVRIPIFDWPSKIFYVDVFCSDSGEWRNFEVSCDQDVEWFECDNENVVTTLNGVLYWMERSNRMLVYNMNQNNESDGHQCSLIDLPDADISDNEFGTLTSRILGESEGRICYASTRVTNRKIIVSVWVLDDDNWQMLHKDISIDKTLTEIYSLIGDVGKVRILGFNPQDSNIVLLGRKHWVWEFNIETGSFEELDHSSLLTNRHMNVTGKMVLPFVLKVMPTKFSPSSW
ncbi:F-box protein At1g49990-like [Papaver somniferum]|uniref:F-box protein At1g49990-like n=1 Tax=Papaver somniferum TaxID=3469 RepID=UPI000E6F576F|nr:F-box protein At1g49990-like [Papaver somniferum]